MMSDNENSPVFTPPSLPAETGKARLNPWIFIAVVALGLAAWQWQETRSQLAETREEISRRLAEADTGDMEERGVQKVLREEIDALQGKLGAVEEELESLREQRTTLDQLTQDLARSREDAILIEVEQAIALASQQLQFAGNAAVAARALQAADARLARLDKVQYLPLRKALAKDLERLNALPFVDVAGLSLRLEQMVAGIDRLPLAAYGRPGEASSKMAAADATVGMPWWRTMLRDAWQELRSLVRIQRFDQEEPALLAPGQTYFLRENLKLRLLTARLALFARDQASFRNELKLAQEWLGRHFVNDDKAVQAALATLRQMAASDLTLELPSLNDSQAALRAVRGGKDKR